MRNLEVPLGATKAQLIEKVYSKRDVPIVQVRATRELVESLVHEQLITYLKERGYVVLNKGKLLGVVPDSYTQTQEKELLKSALRDYEENCSENESKINRALEKALTSKFEVRSSSDLTLMDFKPVYLPLNIHHVLTKFCGEKSSILLDDEKVKIARDSLNFFGHGEVTM